MDRGAKSVIGIVGVFLMFVLMASFFVLATYEVRHAATGNNGTSIVEDISTTINITINNTQPTGLNNISQVNISLYGNFEFLFDTNISNVSTPTVTFSNTSDVLSFTNYSIGLIGNNTNNTYLSFNVTASTPGKYNISVRTLNGTGPDGYSEFNLSVIVNDTTSPNVTFNNLSNQGNYSGAITTNIQILDNFLNGLGVADYAGFVYLNITNATILDNMNETKIYNVTNISGNYFNVTIYTNNYSDGLYNITVLSNDSTGNANNSEYITVRFDQTVPSEINVSSTHISRANYSGTIVLNFSVIDVTSSGGMVWVNISNSTDAAVIRTHVNATSSSSYYWLVSIDTANYTDGTYNISVTANDSAGNTNTTLVVLQDIRFDNTAPTGNMSCSPNPVIAGASTTCICSTSDESGGSGINASATSVTAGPDTSNTGSFTQTCAFVDLAGNTGSVSTSLVVNIGGGGNEGGGSGGSTTSPRFYTKTVPVINKDFSQLQVINQQLKPKEQIKIKFGESEEGKNDGEIHHIGVRSVTLSSAVVEIASDPVRIELDIGEDAKVDLIEDEFYDIYVRLNKIENGKADLTINYIHEAVPVVEEPEEGDVEGVDTTGEIVPIEDEEESNVWIWVVVIVIVVLIAAGVPVAMKKKRK
jgi:hypothetical protein